MVGMGVAAGLALSTAKPPFSFRNRVVVITGGSRGLGLVMARKLVDEGAAIAICGRDRDTLQRAAGELRDRGGATQ